ncbi:TetR/AcrR family transcriptional regulator [Actinomycetospora termitidis]|uniref:TetR/AcrR family transcriptional regulator n=1 Tax=Actinomycetospora termitidis TaxID=3053470 RepID=A0ABT7ME60_9PSEU|nr:TetR/AcrR family transcriptional regulator [Actinomycetospora sp. Odt1-22]MDL5158277.1 TetR/AcrR family transcriptional regulator [Actinomycetospora sp. Odt1-22]
MTTAPRLTAKGRATRDRIVAAATDLIAVRGVAGLSLDEVRRAAEVSGSQLYHYFDGKQALIRAVITRQATAGPSPEIGALDSQEALRAWADAAIEYQERDRGVGGCTLGSLAGELAVGDDEARAELSSGFLSWQGILREGLAAMCDRGDLRADADLDELALALLAALAGGNVLSRTMRTTDPLRAALDAALARVASFAP